MLISTLLVALLSNKAVLPSKHHDEVALVQVTSGLDPPAGEQEPAAVRVLSGWPRRTAAASGSEEHSSVALDEREDSRSSSGIDATTEPCSNGVVEADVSVSRDGSRPI